MAYAVSILIEILEQDQYHLNLDTKPRIQSFLEKVRSFRDFLLYPYVTPGYLTLRIIDAAHKAEDAIEVHTIEYHDDDGGGGAEEVSRLDLSLTEVVNEFESIKQEITEIIIDAGLVSYLPINHSPPDGPALLKVDPRRRSNVVVFEDDFQTLKKRLIGGPSKLQIIPLVGVIGIVRTLQGNEKPEFEFRLSFKLERVIEDIENELCFDGLMYYVVNLCLPISSVQNCTPCGTGLFPSIFNLDWCCIF